MAVYKKEGNNEYLLLLSVYINEKYRGLKLCNEFVKHIIKKINVLYLRSLVIAQWDFSGLSVIFLRPPVQIQLTRFFY